MMVILVTTNVPVEAVKDFKVGGGFGWQQPDADDIAMYNMWAAAYRFHMGDSLCEFVTVFLILLKEYFEKEQRKIKCFVCFGFGKFCGKLWLVYMFFSPGFLSLAKDTLLLLL
jgi:hypothetical protein